MKLNTKTIGILKNFSTINPSILIKKGKNLQTISMGKEVMASAVVEDDFPQEFGIYDLPQFLNVMNTLGNPDLTFKDNSVILDDGEMKLEYRYCAPALITTPNSDKKLEIKKATVAFKLTEKNLTKLLRVASTLTLPNLVVSGKNGKISVKVEETGNDASNSATLPFGEYEGDDFEAVFKNELLTLLPGDYQVTLTKGFALFTSEDETLKYFVVMLSKKEATNE